MKWEAMHIKKGTKNRDYVLIVVGSQPQVKHVVLFIIIIIK